MPNFIYVPQSNQIWAWDNPSAVSISGYTPGGTDSLAILTVPNPATVGTAYSFTPIVTGGSGTKSYALSDVLGQTVVLPPGLSFNASTGAITGTPTHSGYYSGFKITVTDDSGSAESDMFGIYLYPSSALASFGARAVSVGDSITSQGASTGLRNFNFQLQARLRGKLLITVGSDQGVGGQTMTQINSRIDDTTDQKPQFIINHWGHNDSFNSGSVTLSTLRTRARTIINNQLNNTTAEILILTTAPSLVPTNDQTLYAQFVRELKADVTAFYASPANLRIHIIDSAPGYDAATFNIQDSGNRIHPNSTGAKWMSDAAFYYLENSISTGGPLLPTSRGGSELLTNWQQAGTGGTLTNCTGTAPDGFTITNNLGGTSAVSVSNSLLTTGVYWLEMTATGTPAATNTITIDYPAITITGGGAGSLIQAAARIIAQQTGGGAAVGLRNFAIQLGTTAGTGNLGQAGISTADPNPNDSPDPAAAIDWQPQTYTKMYWDTLTTAYLRITFRFDAVAIDSTMRISLPSVFKAETTAYAAPAYAPTTQTQNWLYNINGTLSNGSTLTAIFGTITGGNIVGNATYQWTKNGSDIGGATSATYVPSGFTSGDVLGCTVTIANGISPDLVLTLPTRTFA